MLPPFAINLVLFTFLFLMAKIIEITNLVVNYRLKLSTVFLMLLYATPHPLVYILPMSVMVAVLLTFLRLSADNEITAMKAAGIHMNKLLPAVFTFCLLGALLTFFIVMFAMPWGKLGFKNIALKAVTSNAGIAIEERVFNDRFKGVMLYVNKIDLKTKDLIDIFIEDRRTENVVSAVVAPKGKLFSEPEKMQFHLRLFNGTINQVELGSKSAHSINFNTYDVNLDVARAIRSSSKRAKDEDEMTFGELKNYIKNSGEKNSDYYFALMEFHKKFSIPFACFVLGLLAIPLGVQSSYAGRTFGLVLGLFFFVIYYLLLSLGYSLGQSGIYPPLIGMWVPNIIIGIIGIFLLYYSKHENKFRIDIWTGKFIKLMLQAKAQLTQKKENEQDTVSSSVNPPEPAEADPITGEPEFVASKNASIFHRSECARTKGIRPQNFVGFETREEAMESGKTPCRICKP